MFSFFKTEKKAPSEERGWDEFSGAEEMEVSAGDAIRIGLPDGWF